VKSEKIGVTMALLQQRVMTMKMKNPYLSTYNPIVMTMGMTMNPSLYISPPLLGGGMTMV